MTPIEQKIEALLKSKPDHVLYHSTGYYFDSRYVEKLERLVKSIPGLFTAIDILTEKNAASEKALEE